MQTTLLRSGSGGNATLFASTRARVLVDAGLSPRALGRELAALFADEERPALSAIVITHAHRDHVGHAGRIAKMWGVPVYLSEATARHVRLEGGVETRTFHPRSAFEIGDLIVTPLPLPHDAAQVSLVFDDGDHRVGLATDLGEVPPALCDHFAGCETLLLESNHDPDLLAQGPYPAFLKDRIASARGHLSNVQTHALLRALPACVRTIALLHLSETNNTPALARTLAEDALAGRDVALHVAEPQLPLTLPRRPSARPHLSPPRQLSLFG